MKFIHTGGNATDIDGYTFFFKNPVDITNANTIDKLLKNPNFKVWEEKFEPLKTEAKPEAKPEVKTEHYPACKKCGKEFKRGLFVHEKYCKGNK